MPSDRQFIHSQLYISTFRFILRDHLNMKLILITNWLLLLAYFLLLPWTTTAEQFYVISSSSTSCPRELEPCHTLTDMVQNPSQYFASNTVITLLPGDHQTNISRNLTVLIKDVRNVSLIGSQRLL